MATVLGVKTSSKWASRNIALLVVCVGAILVLIPLLWKSAFLFQLRCVLTDHPIATWIIEKVFSLSDKFGDACIIAGVIGLLVDEGQKTKLIQTVVEAASFDLIGKNLPDPIRKALLGNFEIKLVRPAWTIEYEIQVPPRAKDSVVLTSLIEGQVVNYGSRTEEYTVTGSIDSPLTHPILGQSRIKRIRLAPEVGDVVFDENPPDNKSLLRPDGTLWFQKSHPIPPGQRFKTTLEVEEYRPISYIMPLFTTTVVSTVTVKIRYDTSLLDIQVSTGLSENLKPEPIPWGHVWEIKTPLLPGQCILTTWNPKFPVMPPAGLHTTDEPPNSAAPSTSQ